MLLDRLVMLIYLHVRLRSAINNIEGGFDCIVSGFEVSLRFFLGIRITVHTYND